MERLKEQDVVGLVTMTRKERLNRWADLIRSSSHYRMIIFHNLEKWKASDLDMRIYDVYRGGNTAFAIAMSDKVFNIQGLPSDGSFKDVMDFFTLSQRELHAFSCDCGGEITNECMARTIVRLAG
jgi:hypothetical protein